MKAQESLLEKFRAIIRLPQSPHKKTVYFLAVSGIKLLKRGLLSGLISYHQLFIAERRTESLSLVIRDSAQKTTGQYFFQGRHSTLIVSAWHLCCFDRKFVM